MKKDAIHYAPAVPQREHFDKIIAAFTPLKVNRNKYLLSEGEVCNALYYVQQGCIRTFFINKEGAEKTSAVMVENDFGTAWTSFISRQPSLQFIEAAENTKLLTISYTDFHHNINTDNTWKDFYLSCLEGAYLNQSRKIEALMVLDAKQRYQKLLKGNPGLIQRLSNKVLASFLDMREETLSRVKSKK
ncbi:Crp/Fnr family transcriptional regulator [Chitinophaga sp.]|uniref:Crp/Fnr family transcriptional regulator n=1 Tax=Chitinophaga sp. TaxID=1869181 RepID=UPI002F94C34B